MSKIIRPAVILMTVFLILSMAGCDGGSVNNSRNTESTEDGSGKSDSKYEEYDRKAAAVNKTGEEAFSRLTACGEYHFNREGRAYIDGNILTGKWVKTDEKIFGEEYPNHYDIWYLDIEDSYDPGREMKAVLTFRVEYDDIGESDDVWGSMYFADIGDSEGSLDDKPVVREYFKKTQNDDTYEPVEMSRFGKDNDGRHGSAKGSDGDLEYYYDARAAFPRLCAEGDKIYVVLDISDREGTVITRYLWEYTFKMTEPDKENADETDHGPEDYPEYYSVEYPGCWNMTDIRFIGGDGEEIRDGDVTITAQRYGVEGEDMVYTFKGDDGSYTRIHVPDFYPTAKVFAGGSFFAWIKNTAYRDPEDAVGNLHCSLALADVEFDTGKYGIKIHPRQYIDTLISSMSEGETFEAPGRIVFDGSFPAGQEDGEKIYLAYGVMDGFSGGVRMYNIYEYTYTMGPVTEWVYNPPMPD